jgi:hypothetical protein
VVLAAVLSVLIGAALLGGCAATRQEVAAQLGQQFIGKNVDQLVVQFGPPASSFRMNSGETSYVWQLDAVTSIDTDRYGGTAKTYFCKVNVISSPAGIVTQLTTEDSSGTGGVVGLLVDVYGSVCARRLGIKRQT